MKTPQQLKEVSKGILKVLNYFMLANVIAAAIMLGILLLVRAKLT